MNLGLINPNDPHAVRRAFQTIQSSLGYIAEPTFAGLTLTGLTATRLIASNASKELVSTDLNSWVAGTANEINITDDGDGTITIGIVDPLIVGKGGTGAATLTDHGILLGSGTGAITPLAAATNGQLPIGSTGADPVLAGLTGTTNQITVTNGAGSITLSTPQNIHTGASPTFADLTLSAPSSIYSLSHDSFTDFVAAEHLSLPNTIANVLSDHDLAAHTALGLFDASSDVDHDATTNVHQDVNTTASPTFANIILADGGALKVSDANPQIILDNTSGYIEMTGSVGIGITAPQSNLHVSADGNAVAAALVSSDPVIISQYDTAPGFAIISAGPDAGDRAVFKGTRCDGTLASPTAPAANDMVLTIGANIFDGTATQLTGAIDFYVDGAVSTNVAPCRISFVTSATTGAARTEKLRITSDGGFLLKEIAAAVTDVAAYGQIWIKNDTPNTLWFTDDAGNDRKLNITSSNLLTACATNAGALDFSAASKTLTIEDNAVVSQDYSTDATPTFASLNTTSTAPIITIWNTTQTDSIGERDCGFIAKGEQSGGEITTLGYFKFEHDTALDDEAARFIIGVNDGNDGDNPTTRVTLKYDGRNIFYGTFVMQEVAAALSDSASYGQIWVKNDAPNTLWFTNDVGTDVQLGLNDKVKIDAAATAGYIGAASNDGVLRVTTTNGLTYTDGGDFITIAFDADYTDISGNDATTDVTGAELEELTDGSDTTLHTHGKHEYVDRGDPASSDYTEATLTLDGNYHDLDLSSIVPAGAVLVHLKMYVVDDAVGSQFVFRENGNSNSENVMLLETQVANQAIMADGWVACDANRVIEYRATNTTWTAIYITVRGWFL